MADTPNFEYLNLQAKAKAHSGNSLTAKGAARKPF
jgi:hypothetical protein